MSHKDETTVLVLALKMGKIGEMIPNDQ